MYAHFEKDNEGGKIKGDSSSDDQSNTFIIPLVTPPPPQSSKLMEAPPAFHKNLPKNKRREYRGRGPGEMLLLEEQCGHERKGTKQGRGPKGPAPSRHPLQGAAQRWAGRPRPRPEHGLAIPWERAPGEEGGRRPGVPTERMQEATWSHRSMLSSVGLEKQVCNSFSQNSSSSWIRGREKS